MYTYVYIYMNSHPAVPVVDLAAAFKEEDAAVAMMGEEEAAVETVVNEGAAVAVALFFFGFL